jgi:DNA repair protein RecN (Recombination protein N)
MGSVGRRVYDRCVLRRLHIENLVLIREAELELAPGLNAITGETGAGKTILAQALGLLLGAKGDDSYVGAAAEEAYVEADRPAGRTEGPVSCGRRTRTRPRLRRVFGDGRTRAYAWGRARRAGTLPRPWSASWPCRASSSNGGSRGRRTSSGPRPVLRGGAARPPSS